MKETSAADRQHAIVHEQLRQLMAERPDCYYAPTADIARLILAQLALGAGLSIEDRQLMASVSARQIEMMLSLK